MTKTLLILFALPLLASCGSTADRAAEEPQSNEVQTSGKSATPLSEIPPDVVAVARAAQPDLKITEAEAETRDGRRYFDVAGTMPDDSEMELDIMEDGGRWRVVETQRDIAFSAAPAAVQNAARSTDATIEPSRVIESRQADGIVIYELFSATSDDPQGRKLEIKWDGRQASVLTAEWAH